MCYLLGESIVIPYMDTIVCCPCDDDSLMPYSQSVTVAVSEFSLSVPLTHSLTRSLTVKVHSHSSLSVSHSATKPVSGRRPRQRDDVLYVCVCVE